MIAGPSGASGIGTVQRSTTNALSPIHAKVTRAPISGSFAGRGWSGITIAMLHSPSSGSSRSFFVAGLGIDVLLQIREIMAAQNLRALPVYNAKRELTGSG